MYNPLPPIAFFLSFFLQGDYFLLNNPRNMRLLCRLCLSSRSPPSCLPRLTLWILVTALKWPTPVSRTYLRANFCLSLLFLLQLCCSIMPLKCGTVGVVDALKLKLSIKIWELIRFYMRVSPHPQVSTVALSDGLVNWIFSPHCSVFTTLFHNISPHSFRVL